MLKEMSGQELAEVLSEMADRVATTVHANQEVVERLRKAALDLEAKKGNPHA